MEYRDLYLLTVTWMVQEKKFESGQGGVEIDLYDDVDASGTVNGGDIFLETVITSSKVDDSEGRFSFDSLMTMGAGGSDTISGSISIQVSGSIDDAEEEGSDGSSLGPGGMYLNSSDLEMTEDPNSSHGTQKVGVRFNNISIPQGATITNAYLTFTSDTPDSGNSNSGTTNLLISGQASDSPSSFSATTNDISNRATTTANVNWSPSAWTLGNQYNSPGINSVVQELIDRSGWSSGNSMVFIVTGTGSRVAHSYDGVPSQAPVLHIDYQYISQNGGQSWPYKRKLTFNNSSQSENLVNFPVLIKLNSSRIDYSNTQNSGQDLRFYDADGITLLAHEIESWNESGDSYVWVKVPQIDGSSSADYIWMYYGNDGASDGQDPNNVWDSNYQGVWHLDETSGDHADATSNGNDGTPEGNVIQNTTGYIGGANDFDGSDDAVSVPDAPSLDISSAVTLSAWIKPDNSNTYARIADKSHTSAAEPWTMYGIYVHTTQSLLLHTRQTEVPLTQR